MIVSDSTIQAEGLGIFFKNVGRIYAKPAKNIATKVLKNPGRALEFTSNIATVAATKTSKAVCHHYLKCLISIILVEGCTLGSLFK